MQVVVDDGNIRLLQACPKRETLSRDVLDVDVTHGRQHCVYDPRIKQGRFVHNPNHHLQRRIGFRQQVVDRDTILDAETLEVHRIDTAVRTTGYFPTF